MYSIILLAALLLPQAPPQATTFFVSPVPGEAMRGKQAVIETSLGTIVVDLLPDAAPNHAAYFIKLAGEHAYDGTTFHRMVKYGIVQGGDPISKDPSRRDLYGSGGLGVLRAEISAEKHTRGAMSAVQLPGKPDSAGAQFFICVVDQPALDGKYTVFGRVVEGIRVAERISETAVDDKGKATERVEIRAVSIRDRPAETPELFSTETVAELAGYRAVLETSVGSITLELWPDKAPNHVRNFLRLASLGVYDGMTFHRVVPGFVVQTGHVPTRREPLTERQQAVIRTLQPEFNDTRHDKGVVSMARMADVASASTSFFICTGRTPELDGQYTAFGRVVDGLQVLDAIEKVPTENERPKTGVELIRVRTVKQER